MTSREAIQRAQGRIGKVLQRKYRIDKVLGAGGMAVVYEVTHRNQKRFALKMLHTELSMNEDVRRRFLREGYAANTVDHPGAVVLLDDDTAEDGAAFLVMELLDGEPLDELLTQHERRMPAEAVLSAAEQTLDVLAAAHAKGIVHRDIKPANLFVLRDGTLKVLDFGIARLNDMAGSSQATHTGVMLGTPAYMPPEQALSQASQIDAQTDLWSVGATMFTLLSGANVHQGQTATQILVAAASLKARDVTSVAPWVDPRVAAVIARAVEFDKKDRWPSAEAMRDAVRKVSEEVFGAPPSRASLGRLIAPGQRKAANPEAFIVTGSDAGAPKGEANGSGPRTAVTVQVGAGGAAVGDPASPRAESVAAPVSTPQALGGSSVAFSTAKPVSGGGTQPGLATSPRKGGMQWIAIAAVLLGAGALLVALRGPGKTTDASAPPPPVTSIPVATAAPPPPATPPAPPLEAPAVSAAPSASAPEPAPAPRAATTAAAPVPARSVERAPAPRPAPSVQPRPAPAAKKTSDDDLFHP